MKPVVECDRCGDTAVEHRFYIYWWCPTCKLYTDPIVRKETHMTMIKIPAWDMETAKIGRSQRKYVAVSDLTTLLYETAAANRADFPAVAQAFEMLARSLKQLS